MGNNQDENMEKSVYEEWRTYPPVPESKIKTEIFPESSKDIEIATSDLFDGKNQIEDR